MDDNCSTYLSDSTFLCISDSLEHMCLCCWKNLLSPFVFLNRKFINMNFKNRIISCFVLIIEILSYIEEFIDISITPQYVMLRSYSYITLNT